MNVPVSAMAKPAGSELVLTRDIAALRERLFAAWSDIEQASVSFTDIGGGKTRLTLWHTGFETEASRDDHRGGWTGGLERCAAFVEIN